MATNSRSHTIVVNLTQQEFEHLKMQASPDLENYCRERLLKPSPNKNFSSTPHFISKLLKFSSLFCLMTGGIMVASKSKVTSYGFIFLALSSSQATIASYLLSDRWNFFIFGTTFLIVDLFGVLRWIFNIDLINVFKI